jgi:hypothetical protein
MSLGVVREDDSGGVVFEGLLHDFAGVSACAVDGAAEEVLAGVQAMAVVEVDQREYLVGMLCESGHQVVGGGPWRAQCRASADLAGDRLSCAGHDFVEGRLAVVGAWERIAGG